MEQENDFEEFFRAVFPKVRSTVVRVTGSVAAAEDAAAEAFARCYVRWGHLGASDHRDAWVMRVALNLAIDAARSASRRPTGVSSVVVSADGGVLDRLSLSPVLLALPSRQRQAIVLHHVGGMSELEVAEAMGVSVNSVKTHLKRGLAKLRVDPEAFA